jgi:hypothetical protein
MIPTTITGVILFVIFLVPGFIFTITRERHRPTRKLSAFRETSLAVFASVVAFAGGLLIVLVIAWINPGTLPFLQLMISNPTRFSRLHPLHTTAILLAFLLVTSAAATLLGSRPSQNAWRRFRNWLRKLRKHSALDNSDPMGSSWWSLFEPFPEYEKIVGLQLDDGTWIGGTLRSWSRQADENSDRDLILQEPLFLRPPGVVKEESLVNAGAVTVNAGRIRYMTVAYKERSQDNVE